ncbi:MAG: LysR family transcriptional regulator, partial [Erysipelotrichales bacterium]
MNTYKLEYFKVVAEYENVSKAAQKLNISQPALSKVIKDLEKELGYELFDRHNKKIKLNSNGRIVYKYSKIILLSLEDINKELADYNKNKQSNIILSLQAISDLIIPIIKDFNQIHGYTDFIITQGIFKNENYDLEIFSSTKRINEDNTICLLKEDIDLVVPLSHPLAIHNEIDLNLLDNEKFIALSKHKPFRKICDEYCLREGFSLKSTWESDSPQLIREMLGVCGEIAFIPQKTWDIPNKDKV